jgi:hypothetical protein
MIATLRIRVLEISGKTSDMLREWQESNMVFDSDSFHQRGGERVDNHDSVTAM